MSFTPSPQLERAVRAALQTFARHRPTVFRLANEATEEGRAFVADYARALSGVTLDAIPEAAQRWVAQKPEIPSAALFGAFAKAIDYAEYRPPAKVLSMYPERTPEHAKDRDFAMIERCATLTRDRLRVLGHKGPVFVVVAQVWAILWEAQAPHVQEADGSVHVSGQQQTVWDARFDEDIWKASMDAWEAGHRAKPHPMNNMNASRQFA